MSIDNPHRGGEERIITPDNRTNAQIEADKIVSETSLGNGEHLAFIESTFQRVREDVHTKMSEVMNPVLTTFKISSLIAELEKNIKKKKRIELRESGNSILMTQYGMDREGNMDRTLTKISHLKANIILALKGLLDIFLETKDINILGKFIHYFKESGLDTNLFNSMLLGNEEVVGKICFEELLKIAKEYKTSKDEKLKVLYQIIYDFLPNKYITNKNEA